MHIALIGAPGSGKTKLAKKIAKYDSTFKIVDGYVPKLEKRTNIALGYLAPLVPNLMVAAERLAAEHNARDKSENVISCGTVIENIAYTAHHAIVLLDTVDDPVVASVRVNATMDALMLFLEAWYYDYVFYLPLVQSEDTSEYALKLDHSIRDILTTFRVDHIPLTEENPYETVISRIEKENQVGSGNTGERRLHGQQSGEDRNAAKDPDDQRDNERHKDRSRRPVDESARVGS